MSCERIREHMQDELDGLLSDESSRALHAHLSSCSSCRVEFEAFRALDAALVARPLDHAPRWLPGAVLSQIEARASVRARAERVAIAVGIPAGLFSIGLGIRAAVIATGVGDAVAGAASALGGPIREVAASIVEAPGLSAYLASNPGVQGVVWALAASALSFLAITALRLTRKHSLGWN